MPANQSLKWQFKPPNERLFFLARARCWKPPPQRPPPPRGRSRPSQGSRSAPSHRQWPPPTRRAALSAHLDPRVRAAQTHQTRPTHSQTYTLQPHKTPRYKPPRDRSPRHKESTGSHHASIPARPATDLPAANPHNLHHSAQHHAPASPTAARPRNTRPLPPHMRLCAHRPSARVPASLRSGSTAQQTEPHSPPLTPPSEIDRPARGPHTPARG